MVTDDLPRSWIIMTPRLADRDNNSAIDRTMVNWGKKRGGGKSPVGGGEESKSAPDEGDMSTENIVLPTSNREGKSMRFESREAGRPNAR